LGRVAGPFLSRLGNSIGGWFKNSFQAYARESIETILIDGKPITTTIDVGIKATKTYVSKALGSSAGNIIKGETSNLPNQIHHFATNKNKVFTPEMAKVADEFGLKLNEAWNKQLLPHLGRHPNDYHKFVLQNMRRAASESGGKQTEFLRLFDQYIKQPVIQNPTLLRKSGW
jgi:A nuclease family of the HNH/ENDO VII superfamily with conserved AHH